MSSVYSDYLEMLGIVHLRRVGDYNEGEMNGVKVLYQFIDSPFVSNPDTHSLSTNMLKRAYLESLTAFELYQSDNELVIVEYFENNKKVISV